MSIVERYEADTPATAEEDALFAVLQDLRNRGALFDNLMKNIDEDIMDGLLSSNVAAIKNATVAEPARLRAAVRELTDQPKEE